MDAPPSALAGGAADLPSAADPRRKLIPSSIAGGWIARLPQGMMPLMWP
jgi:hypothetical protein